MKDDKALRKIECGLYLMVLTDFRAHQRTYLLALLQCDRYSIPMEKHHHHVHNESHRHEPANFGRAFGIGILLNSIFIVAELAYGFHANSLALVADAWHNAGDVLGLLMAWGAVLIGQRQPSARYTYGLQSVSILVALANAILLFIASGSIAWEALQRFWHPEPVANTTVMLVAALGIVINGATAMLFLSGRRDDLNMRGAFLHMATDALVSLGVVISSIIMLLSGWLWVDAVMGLGIAVVIILGTWQQLRDSVDLALHATPKHIKTEQVKAFLAALEGVQEVSDLHIWGMSTHETSLSAHLLMKGGYPGKQFLVDVAHQLEHHFRIGHSTIQLDFEPHAVCKHCPQGQ